MQIYNKAMKEDIELLRKNGFEELELPNLGMIYFEKVQKNGYISIALDYEKYIFDIRLSDGDFSELCPSVRIDGCDFQPTL